VQNTAGEWTHKPPERDVTIAPPAMVSVTSTNPKYINYFPSPGPNDPVASHTITWNVNGADHVNITRCVGNHAHCTRVATEQPTSSYEVTNAEIAAALAPSKQGELTYKIQPCMNQTDRRFGSFFGFRGRRSNRSKSSGSTASRSQGSDDARPPCQGMRAFWG
jgi:hypothetical protein